MDCRQENEEQEDAEDEKREGEEEDHEYGVNAPKVAEVGV